MPRCYRYVILPLVGLLIAASPSRERRESENQRTQHEIANALGRTANALEQANRPQRETADCSDTADDRESDLCAQWKAANAAVASAEAADTTVTIGWIGLALGTVTMAAAIAAAWFANEAAKAAVATLTHEQQVSSVQLTAILHIESVDAIGETGLLAPRVSFSIKNLGNIPAKHLTAVGAWGYRSSIEKKPLNLQPCVAPKGISPNGVYTIQLPPSEPQRFNRFSTLYCQFEVSWEFRAGEYRHIREVHRSDGENFSLLRDY